LWTWLTIKSIPHRRTQNADDDYEHLVLGAADVVAADHRVSVTKIATIVPGITTRIMIVQRIYGFWVC